MRIGKVLHVRFKMLEEGRIKSDFSSTSFFLSSRWTPLEVSQRPCGVNVFSTLPYRVLGRRRWAGWGAVEMIQQLGWPSYRFCLKLKLQWELVL